MFTLITFPFFKRYIKKNIKEKLKVLYINYLKLHHYCKKAIVGKKLILNRSVLHLGSVTPVGGTLENKREEDSHAFSKVLLYKHNLLSERLGMEPLQSTV